VSGEGREQGKGDQKKRKVERDRADERERITLVLCMYACFRLCPIPSFMDNLV